jgi:hypothetical protein
VSFFNASVRKIELPYQVKMGFHVSGPMLLDVMDPPLRKQVSVAAMPTELNAMVYEQSSAFLDTMYERSRLEQSSSALIEPSDAQVSVILLTV